VTTGVSIASSDSLAGGAARFKPRGENERQTGQRKEGDLEILEVMTAPDINGQPSLPRRPGPKGLLPSTWVERTLKVSYVDECGRGVESSGTLLDLYPFGPVLNLSGEKTALAWECLRAVTLIND